MLRCYPPCAYHGLILYQFVLKILYAHDIVPNYVVYNLDVITNVMYLIFMYIYFCIYLRRCISFVMENIVIINKYYKLL